MKSAFFELNVALTGLHTARSGLQITSHNMSNAATPGFSRQFIQQRAGSPINTSNPVGMIGTGSEVYGIGQMRNTHLDHRYWNERPNLGKQEILVNQLKIKESMFGELTENGFSSNFNTFFDTLQDLSTNASDATNRNNIIQSINTLARNINSNASSLLKQQQDINNEISTTVTSINSLGQQISNLNNEIARAEMSGGNANDLRDQRALLVDELSLLVNINVTETNSNGSKHFIIHIDGQEFIRNDGVNILQASRRTEAQKRNPHDADGLYEITFANGKPFNMYSSTLGGELKGLIDMRDGNGGVAATDYSNTTGFRGIPYYIATLNNMINTFSDAFNFGTDHLGNPIPGVTGHVNGYNANGENTGMPLFTGTPRTPDDPLYEEDPWGLRDLNIFNFQLNPEIAKDQNLLATSTKDKGESSNDLILGFVQIKNYQSLFREGTLNDYINAMTGELAMDLKHASNFKESQSDVLVVLQNQRLQVKGVDINEEIMSMMFFQQQYQSAARLVNVINEVYDTMINRMGV